MGSTGFSIPVVADKTSSSTPLGFKIVPLRRATMDAADSTDASGWWTSTMDMIVGPDDALAKSSRACDWDRI